MKSVLEVVTLIGIAILAWGKITVTVLGIGLIIYICWWLTRAMQQTRSCT